MHLPCHLVLWDFATDLISDVNDRLRTTDFVYTGGDEREGNAIMDSQSKPRADLLPDSIHRLQRKDPVLADEIGGDFQRLLLAGQVVAEAQSQLPKLVAAGSVTGVLHTLVDEARLLTGARGAWALSWSGTLDHLSFEALATAGEAVGADAVPTPDQISSTVVGEVARDGRPAWSDDATSDQRFNNASSVQALQLRSVGCLPIGGHGVLYIHDPRRVGLFTADERARLAALCSLAAPFVAPMAIKEATLSAIAAPAIAGLVGQAQVMEELRGTIAAFAPMPWPALILGETGTGKETIARSLHTLSPRADRPFVPVNCGAIPESLAESLLFGHEKGAFTGADRQKAGLVERVDGGTLFLDEVGELPATAQVKLLRLLQEGTYERVGGERELAFNGRIVAATLRAVDRPEERGDFREDLYHRLGACVLRAPALRDHRVDVPIIAEYLLERSLKELGGVQLQLSVDALAALRTRGWPGNVRELENCLRSAIARALAAHSPAIEPGHLEGDTAREEAQALGSLVLPVDLVEATERYQQALVRAALEEAAGNRTRAAEQLGVSRQWLHRLVTRWGEEF